MKYAIIGSGDVGTALARAFAHKNIPAAIANSRGPETLSSLAKELGASVLPQSIQDALTADMIFLAVPFPAHKSVAKQRATWIGKIVVDVTNALDASSGELGERLSSEIVAEAFEGADLVKAFNHLPAEQLGTNRSKEPQVIFVSSNVVDASKAVASLVTQLGFAPIELGRLDQGGVPLHAINHHAGGLLFQDLVKT